MQVGAVFKRATKPKDSRPPPRNLTILWATRRAALSLWITLRYVEKVRPQFLTLRHPYSALRFLHRWMGRKSPVNWGISIAATVLEIAELRHFSLGDGIFLRSFVLCGFSIVSKSEVPEAQLEIKIGLGSNLCWMSESN